MIRMPDCMTRFFAACRLAERLSKRVGFGLGYGTNSGARVELNSSASASRRAPISVTSRGCRRPPGW